MTGEQRDKGTHFTTAELNLIEYLVTQAMENSSRMGNAQTEDYQKILNKLPFYRAVAFQIAQQ
ncbi:MAG: hypothetical protein KDJ65_20695 [Anaerolineae bacterium]|nr:hypothetical protein [Anaerolineae bacterium]